MVVGRGHNVFQITGARLTPGLEDRLTEEVFEARVVGISPDPLTLTEVTVMAWRAIIGDEMIEITAVGLPNLPWRPMLDGTTQRVSDRTSEQAAVDLLKQCRVFHHGCTSVFGSSQ